MRRAKAIRIKIDWERRVTVVSRTMPLTIPATSSPTGTANRASTVRPVVTVAIVDDHPLYRDGLVHALGHRPEIAVVSECGDARSALQEIVALDSAVSLVDLRLPDLTGFELLRRIKESGSSTRVVLMSASGDSAQAIAAGAYGYASKAVARDEICAVVTAVAGGEKRVAAGPVAGDVALTPREGEVLALTAEGCSARQIGRRLNVSETTVKSHLKNMYGKLGVSDRAAAVAVGMRRGLLE